MRTRFAFAAAIVLGLALAPIARADDKGSDSKGDKSSGQTIHGVVAGVTVEGETVVDYKAKKAVEVEAAFLTVVGMPGHHHEGSANTGDQGKEHKAGETSGHHRPNVYQVWLSPKTKVCTCCDDSGNKADKKECGLGKLEVGDHVEITFARRDDSANNAGANLSEEMKGKHGRHRIRSVDAQEITILPAEHPEQSGSSGSKDKGKGGQDSK